MKNPPSPQQRESPVPGRRTAGPSVLRAVAFITAISMTRISVGNELQLHVRADSRHHIRLQEALAGDRRLVALCHRHTARQQDVRSFSRRPGGFPAWSEPSAAGLTNERHRRSRKTFTQALGNRSSPRV